MRKTHSRPRRLSTAVVLALMLAGCGGDSDDNDSNDASASSDSGATVEAMLDKWEAGEKQAALGALLEMDWSNPPLAEHSLLAVSNTELAEQGDVAKAAELAQQAHEEYFEDWYALGEHALEQLDKARAAGDDARARELETSLDAMSEYLKKPEHLGIFQRLGPALEPLAPGEIQLPEGF